MNTMNTSNIISIRTQIVLLGFHSNRSALVNVESKMFNFKFVFHFLLLKRRFLVQNIPTLPKFTVTHRTESMITIQRVSREIPSELNRFEYRIQCGLDQLPEIFDIRSSEVKCRSLESGTNYQINLSVLDMSTNLRQSMSLYTQTGLSTDKEIDCTFDLFSNAF